MRTLQNTVFNAKRLIDKVSATAKAVSPKLLDLSKEAATSIKDGWNGEHIEKAPARAEDIGGYTNRQVEDMLREHNKLTTMPIEELTPALEARIDELENALEDAGITQ